MPFDFDFRFRCRDCLIAGGAALTGTWTTEHLFRRLAGEHSARELRRDSGAKLIVGEVLNQGAQALHRAHRASMGRSTDSVRPALIRANDGGRLRALAAMRTLHGPA